MNGNLTFFIKLNKRATLNWRFTILRRLSWVFFFLTLNSAYPNPCIPLAKWFVLQLQWFSCLSILWFIFINNIKKWRPILHGSLVITCKNDFLKFYFFGYTCTQWILNPWCHPPPMQGEEDLVELESIEISCKNAMMPLFMRKGKFH